MQRKFFVLLLLFLLLNTAIYSTINQFHSVIPFNTGGCKINSVRFTPNWPIKGWQFLAGLDQWDAQWYLKIAHNGYANFRNDSLSWPSQKAAVWAYNFFPLYPLLVHVSTLLIAGNQELGAFLLSVILLIANFCSLYYVSSKIYSETIAQKAVFLFFFFPFSIFFRSFYTESLFLFFLIWFVYALWQKRFLFAAVLLGLANVTRGSGLFIFVAYFFHAVRRLEIKRALFFTALALLPIGGWAGFNWWQTGNPLTFVLAQGYTMSVAPFPFISTLASTLMFPALPVHGYHVSQIDSFMVILVLVLLIKSRSFLNSELWWVSFLLWLMPVALRDTMSFSRFQSVSFPLFIYLASVLKSWRYILVFVSFYGSLLLASVFFVNCYWIG